MDLTADVKTLPGVGSVMAKKLEKLEIKSVFDLLYHVPFRYEDRSLVSSASLVQPGETVTIIATTEEIKNVHTAGGKVLQWAQVSDASGRLPVVWFNQPFLPRTLAIGSRVALWGKVDFLRGRPTLISPEYELVGHQPALIHSGRLVPVYPETAGVSSKWLRAKIFGLLPQLVGLDFLPAEIIGRLQLLPWPQALAKIHFPANLAEVAAGHRRLAFDELLLLQLTANKRRQAWAQTRLTHAFEVDGEKILQFISRLPFTLTPSQNQAIKEILADLAKTQPMNRLLEGDVGSGKTVVAAIAAYVAHLNGYQSLVMAPTQILATQHHVTLSTLFNPLGINVDLVISGHKKRTGWSQIVVGTQAVLAKNLHLDRVGLVIIDEQHRFGVAQRAIATAKGQSPHTLTMTATPIPRTVALTMYGDLDLSTLDDLPAGRLPVKTWVVPESKRAAAYEWIRSQVSDPAAGRQAFIVCPFIEESETLTTVKAATAEFEKLKPIFPDLRLGLLHGKLKAKDKERIINKFRAGEDDILVATPVVEVGIDIPNATIMVVEGADRFGLAQLHQLRGRVGRRQQQAYCLLFAPHPTARLKAMETHHLGLELAEIDLRLRGPGEIYGTSQHGQPHFRVASYQDLDLMELAKTTAENLLPQLEQLPTLRSLVEKDKIELVQPN